MTRKNQPLLQIPSTIWLTFTAFKQPNPSKEHLLFEYFQAANTQYSNIVKTSSSGQFSTPVQCALRLSGPHKFILHRLVDKRQSSSSSKSVNSIKPQTSQPKSFSFSIEFPSLAEKLCTATKGAVSETVSVADGCILHFTASITEAVLTDNDDVSVVSSSFEGSDMAEAGSVDRVDLSFSSVSEDDDLTDSFTDLSSVRRKDGKVRFNKKTYTIPTTHQLQDRLDQAERERTSLSRAMGDLSLQMLHVKREMKGLKNELYPHDSTSSMSSFMGDLKCKRRKVVIDGNSLCASYQDGKQSIYALESALTYFAMRGSKAVAVVSKDLVDRIENETGANGDDTPRVRLQHLVNKGTVAICSSQSRVPNYVLQYALDERANIVSNDSFHNAIRRYRGRADKRKLRCFVEDHQVPFMFIAKKFVPSMEGPGCPSLTELSRSETM